MGCSSEKSGRGPAANLLSWLPSLSVISKGTSQPSPVVAISICRWGSVGQRVMHRTGVSAPNSSQAATACACAAGG
jgi:hypothetical protein